MLVSLKFRRALIKKRFVQWKLVNDAPQDISNSHKMELRALEMPL
jgi:hypothetical protein